MVGCAGGIGRTLLSKEVNIISGYFVTLGGTCCLLHCHSILNLLTSGGQCITVHCHILCVLWWGYFGLGPLERCYL